MRIHIIMITWFIALLCFCGVQAQQVNDIGKIALSVVIPENVDELNTSQLSKLETKITQIVTNSGLSASGYNQSFVIYPKFAIYESQVVEGGMQNLTVITTELSLFIKQTDNNMLFSSVSKQLKGSGKTKELAITNAISKIPITDANFNIFLETGKQKIVQYYEVNCVNIIKQADAYVNMQQYEQALGLLMSVPEEVSSCYSQILDRAISVYKSYQKQKCMEQIQQAKTFSASMDYRGALEILSGIDPLTDCFGEAQELVKAIEKKINTEEKKQWDLEMKMYNDAVDLEKKQIDAIKEIAVSYYKKRPTAVKK